MVLSLSLAPDRALVVCPLDCAAVSAPERRYGPGGILTLGGLIVIVGILVLIFGPFWLGLVIILIGLIAFGGFARGRWY